MKRGMGRRKKGGEGGAEGERGEEEERRRHWKFTHHTHIPTVAKWEGVCPPTHVRRSGRCVSGPGKEAAGYSTVAGGAPPRPPPLPLSFIRRTLHVGSKEAEPLLLQHQLIAPAGVTSVCSLCTVFCFLFFLFF